METSNKLAEALVEFQSKVPVIPKNHTAKIKTKTGSDYQYSYADLADMWEAIRTPLKDCGLAVTQHLVGGSDGYTGIKTKIWHKSGETDESTVDVPTGEKSAQEVGSQITYYKRYSLSSALGISTEEDDDGEAGNSKPVSKPRASENKPASDKQIALIKKLAKENDIEQAAIDARLKEIKTSADASTAIKKLQEMQDGN